MKNIDALVSRKPETQGELIAACPVQEYSGQALLFLLIYWALKICRPLYLLDSKQIYSHHPITKWESDPISKTPTIQENPQFLLTNLLAQLKLPFMKDKSTFKKKKWKGEDKSSLKRLIFKKGTLNLGQRKFIIKLRFIELIRENDISCDFMYINFLLSVRWIIISDNIF